MKRYNQFLRVGIPVCLLYLSLLSCKKFVEADPPANRLIAQSVFNNDVTAMSVMTGVYQDMTFNLSQFASGERSLSVLCGLSADELTNFITTTAVRNEFYTNSINPNNTYNQSGLWLKLYNVIFTTNAVYEGVTQSTTLTPSLKTQLQGEAKFIRAFCYFYLTNLYGAVPLALTTDYVQNADLPRSNQNLIYDQIEADLIQAKTLLADDYITPKMVATTERVRPIKATASALLARVYLFRSKFADAERESSSVIENSRFSLVNLSQAFLANNAESIWQAQSTRNNGTNPMNTIDGRFFILLAPPSNNNPVHASSHLLSAFEPNDARKANWIGIYNGLSFPNKYKVATSTTLTENLVVFRLAEQYLIRAEARNMQNKITGPNSAASDLNVVRARAGLSGTASINQSEMAAAILKERQVELFCEWGHRWFDLKRLNLANTVMPSVTSAKGGVWSSTAQLFPIPQTEILKRPNIYTQNPGYPN